MSKIGKQPILVPSGVEVKFEGNLVVIKGPKGELKRMLNPELKGVVQNNQIVLSPAKESKETSALWGLNRMLLYNLIEGVTNGFTKKLELEGIGYKVVLQGKNLILNLGFSHQIEFKAPDGIEFKIEKNTIAISGIDKGLVGQTAADIRKLRPPEPYKGKGIHYEGEVIKRKAGKKAVKGAF